MELPVILNPAADRGRAGQREDEIGRALEKRGLKCRLFRTEGPGHAAELARELLQGGERVVVAAGGDGTLNEAAQALVGTEAALGILPLGSGNDYIRALGIPADLGGAADTLARMDVHLADVGFAAGRWYLNALGMGIDAQIGQDFRGIRVLRGEAAYLAAAVFEIFRFRPFLAEVQGDGWNFSGPLLAVSAMNGPFAGGGFCLAPQASPADGRLDVALLGHYPRLIRLAVLPKTRDGSYLRLKRASRKYTGLLRIEAERALPVHMDGELLPEKTSELEVELRPSGLRVIA